MYICCKMMRRVTVKQGRFWQGRLRSDKLISYTQTPEAGTAIKLRKTRNIWEAGRAKERRPKRPRREERKNETAEEANSNERKKKHV